MALAQNGADVAISDKHLETLEQTELMIQPSGRRIFKLAIDVRDLTQVKAGIEAAESAFARIDILVSNAGINRPLAGLEVDPENWEDHFNTNVRGAFFATERCRKEDDRKRVGAALSSFQASRA